MLIDYIAKIDLREWTFIAGDFNRADEIDSQNWHILLKHYGFTDGHPNLPTFRLASRESKLDRVLLPTVFLRIYTYNIALPPDG